MTTIIMATLVFAGYLVAYHTYGRFLARKIFRLDPKADCPSHALRDNVDYVPTPRQILFGHHFTSIAGLGPIVGPALAIIWGWLPAVLWVFLGSIFMGAVHDLGALVISLRNQGHSIGDIADDLINARVRTIFLLIIFLVLWIVIAVFALIIGILFTMYPHSVLPVWLQIPIAVGLGWLVYQRGYKPGLLGLGAVALMYLTIIGGTWLPVSIPSVAGLDPLAIWIVGLLIYAFVASTLPVQFLLQPRDYINSYQLLLAMLLLVAGMYVTRPEMVAPVVNFSPAGAPPLFPFLFVAIACGAISGFHSLVSSGTSSKQCDSESSALFVGYGGMLVEGALATLVIVAVGAGLGLGLEKDGNWFHGTEAFYQQYASWSAAEGLAAKLRAFVAGSANMVESLGVPKLITKSIMGVFLVSFAATTLDSATRIQRYVVGELAGAWRINVLKGKYAATFVAVATALLLAFSNGSSKGALVLWPLFGAVNQLLAGLTLLVITIYLVRKGVSVWYTLPPMVFMLAVTAWAMYYNLVEFKEKSNYLLLGIGIAVVFLEVWMIVESALAIHKARYGSNRSSAKS